MVREDVPESEPSGIISRLCCAALDKSVNLSASLKKNGPNNGSCLVQFLDDFIKSCVQVFVSGCSCVPSIDQLLSNLFLLGPTVRNIF